MKPTYSVATRDVDGWTSRVYLTRERALRRFESMVGYTVEQVIDETYYNCNHRPTRENVEKLRGVSQFGTVVYFNEIV